MNRREFIALIGGAAAWPLTARAQQAAMPVVGAVWTAPRNFATDRYTHAFRDGLAEMGFTASRNGGAS